MESLYQLLMGFRVTFSSINLFFCLVGVIAGIIIGALPAIGPSTGVALLLPLTFGMNPLRAMIMLAGLYYGAFFGGAISSILINVPGTPPAVVTTFDGYPLALQGRAGPALGMSCIGSFMGGTLGAITLALLCPVLASFALRFGPPEYFALMILALTAVSGLTGRSVTKGLASTILGLFLALVGVDVITGLPRFCFRQMELYSGIGFIPVAMGLFGFAEALSYAEGEAKMEIHKPDLGWSKMFPTLEDWIASRWTILRGSVMGFFIGVLPGAGGTIASFLSYAMAKRASKHPEKFGRGAIEGVAAAECADNAAAMGAFAPLLTLGVPGSATTAIMMGGLLMYGLRPGPLLFERHPDFVWGLIASMYIGNIMAILLMIFFIPLFVQILRLPRPTLAALIIAFVTVGTYSIENSMFDVWLMLLFGIVGYLLKKLDYPIAPVILGLVLGEMLETSLRQSLILSHGSLSIFAIRPLSVLFLIGALISILLPVYRQARAASAKGRSSPN